MITMSQDINDYLEESCYINWKDERILQKAKGLARLSRDEIDLIKKTYHFVRDEIKHSWDVQDTRVTVKASDVLREKVGICWAKAHLLAALLRANGIPAGICYQRLTLGNTPDTGYCIHALNAVYIREVGRWIRIDARGNKEGVQAEMFLDKEQLAFPSRREYNEIDYPKIYIKPAPITIKVLEENHDALYMYLHCLPDYIE